MVTTMSYGNNEQADLWLRNKHIRFQASAALQLGSRVWLWWDEGRPRFEGLVVVG
jgi:hypothetical protein